MSQDFGDPKNPFANNPYQASHIQPQRKPPLAKGTVKNYLVESILCLLCCGGIVAIPAIVYAAQVDSKLAGGDYQGAVDSSNKAKMWCLISVAVGLVCGGLSIGLQILAAVAVNG